MSKTTQSVFLIGMMGAGKTTVGRLLAQALGWRFIDADRELEARSGVPVATIFELEGEAGFRRREAALIEELTRLPQIVLATGGGAVLDPANRRHMHGRGLVIHLRVSAEEVRRRTRRDTHRPLLRTADPRTRIEAILAERGPLYAETAHLNFQSAATNPRRQVERILAAPEMLALLAAAHGTESAPMTSIEVALAGRAYPIQIGPAQLVRLAETLALLQPTRLLVVSNTTVAPLYGAVVQAACAGLAPTALIALPDGEAHKGWNGIAQILDALVALRADRKSVVVALGGGVVGDMAGFAAAIYMRGIRFVQLPTTLLAQVDSSVGGKTGINLPAGKNLIGAFHQPVAVLADTDTLKTLPARELSAGLAEVIKHGLLADAAYLAAIEADMAQLRACEPAALSRAIARSCEIKAGIVARDEHETGERAYLNLGHTFGHAIETLTGYGTWLHGEAVGCGLCLAADLSRRLGYLDAADVARVEAVVAAAGLPVRIPGLSAAAALEAMRGDKKSEGGAIRFIVLEAIGRAAQRTVPPELLAETLAAGGYV